MRNHLWRSWALAVVLGCFGAAAASADECGCAKESAVCRFLNFLKGKECAICQPSCGQDDEVRTVWQVVEEKVCVPGGHGHCGSVRTVRRVVRKEIHTRVPVTRWNVLDPCATDCVECAQ